MGVSGGRVKESAAIVACRASVRFAGGFPSRRRVARVQQLICKQLLHYGLFAVHALARVSAPLPGSGSRGGSGRSGDSVEVGRSILYVCEPS